MDSALPLVSQEQHFPDAKGPIKEIKLNHAMYQLRTVGGQAQDLLEMAESVNETIVAARQLRRSKSALLEASEKTWIDGMAIGKTEQVLCDVAELIEPASGRVSVLRDNPRMTTLMTRLSVASQTLNSALVIMSGRGDGYIASMMRDKYDHEHQQSSNQAPRPPPSYSEADFLFARRRQSRRASSAALSSDNLEASRPSESRSPSQISQSPQPSWSSHASVPLASPTLYEPSTESSAPFELPSNLELTELSTQQVSSVSEALAKQDQVSRPSYFAGQVPLNSYREPDGSHDMWKRPIPSHTHSEPEVRPATSGSNTTVPQLTLSQAAIAEAAEGLEVLTFAPYRPASQGQLRLPDNDDATPRHGNGQSLSALSVHLSMGSLRGNTSAPAAELGDSQRGSRPASAADITSHSTHGLVEAPSSNSSTSSSINPAPAAQTQPQPAGRLHASRSRGKAWLYNRNSMNSSTSSAPPSRPPTS